jgi:hypothetical protein
VRHLIKHKIIGVFIICLFCSVTSIFACRCVITPTEDHIKNSTIIFSGKVVGFEYRKGIPNNFMDEQAKATGKFIDYETLVVKVQVKQWWKGDAPKEIFLVTNETKNADGTNSWSSCDFHFLEDETYLIFADKKGNEYRTSSCSGTRKLGEAEKELKILGEGKKPIEIKDKPNLPLF